MLHLIITVPFLLDCFSTSVDAIWCALQIGSFIGMDVAIKTLIEVGLAVGGTFLFINMFRGRNGGGGSE